MSEPYAFNKDVSPEEWCALPRQFKKGEKVYRFHGHTYGLDRDDMMYLHEETVPCTLEPGGTTFFTVPVRLLVDDNGNEPSGDYMPIEKIRKAIQS